MNVGCNTIPFTIKTKTIVFGNFNLHNELEYRNDL